MLVKKNSEKHTNLDISFDRLLREILNKPSTLEFGSFVENYLKEEIHLI